MITSSQPKIGHDKIILDPTPFSSPPSKPILPHLRFSERDLHQLCVARCCVDFLYLYLIFLAWSLARIGVEKKEKSKRRTDRK